MCKMCKTCTNAPFLRKKNWRSGNHVFDMKIVANLDFFWNYINKISITEHITKTKHYINLATKLSI